MTIMKKVIWQRLVVNSSMGKSLFMHLRNYSVDCKSLSGLTLFLILSSFSLSAFCEPEPEQIDIGSLRAELESSRSDSKSAKTDLPLQKNKLSLDQEEEALIKKLNNVVSDKQEQPAIASVATIGADNAAAKVKDVSVKVAPNEAGIADLKAVSEKKSDEKLQISETKSTEKVALPAAKTEAASSEPAKRSGSEKTPLELRKKVEDLQLRLNDKSKELEETRNRLVIAETQVERLSGILEKLNSAKLAGYMGSSGAAVKPVTSNAAALPKNVANQSRDTNVAAAPRNLKSSEQSLVGTVTAPKAFLRSGPSKEDSPIMSVSKGTRLVVETRNNEWFRVITPTGGRAWISTEMLGFGPGDQPGSDSALRIGGYEKILR